MFRPSFPRTHTRSRRRLLRELLALAAAPAAGWHPFAAAAEPITTPDGRYYDAYVPAASKEGQFYHYTCEFDAAWVVLKTFGYDVGFDEQLAIVGHDMSVQPYYEEAGDGTFVIYGGDITTAFNGDYYNDFLARTTGQAMMPLFQRYELDARPVNSREGIEATLNQGGLVWMKATADFLPWAQTTWVTPSGQELPTVLGNDHAVVVMGYNANGPVIRDVLGPTSSNWNRVYEYDVPWETFLGVFNAQGADGIGVLPPGAAPKPASQPNTTSAPASNADTTIQPSQSSQPSQPAQSPADQAADIVAVCC